ncbi:MAG: flagellar export protein FliJ [Planctomycetaceae bacterium]|nr:flagellar export protein FliJ [Planctomycetaceae bacterium]
MFVSDCYYPVTIECNSALVIVRGIFLSTRNREEVDLRRNRMPFQFRLEPLITIRDNVLKEKQGELAKAYEARRIAEEKKQELEQELSENVAAGRQRMTAGAIDIEFLLGLRRHEMYINAQMDVVQGHLRQIDEEIERRRIAVMEAHKELKIVEKLKEKRYERYQTEENRKEIIRMDETALRKINH